jgi:phosphoglycolate phosphatase-like HAD superfamily hydrolase
MHLVMFDVDETLVHSSSFEDDCYSKAFQEVIHHPINTDWSSYTNVTDSGILHEVIDTHNLDKERDTIYKKVKLNFTNNIKLHITQTPVKEIEGASAFIQILRQRDDVVLAIATGGWEETAKLKLESAGIDYSGIPFASDSDHLTRIGIMRAAETKCLVTEFTSKTYFGDGIWDKKASKELGFNFVLVGNQVIHSRKIMDYSSPEKVLGLMGL